MNKNSILYLVNFIAYIITSLLFVITLAPIEDISSLLGRLGLVFFPFSFTSLPYLLSLPYLFIYLKERYQNKLTFSASIINIITLTPILIGLISFFILGKNFFSEDNPGYFVAWAMLFYLYFVAIPSTVISTVMLIIGIVKYGKNVNGEKSNPLKVLLALFLFVANMVLYPTLIISLLGLIPIIVTGRWINIFLSFVFLIPILLILFFLRFIQKKMNNQIRDYN